MNAEQFRKCFQLASTDLSHVDDSHLHGCALPDFNDGKPIVTTLEPCAKMLRHVGMQLNGEWDVRAVNEFRDMARRKFLIVSA